MRKIAVLALKTIRSLKKEGMLKTAKKVKGWLTWFFRNRQVERPCELVMDVLFINGCDPVALPHPSRYRVVHQVEQLLANNIVSNTVYYTDLSIDQVRYYRVFIFFRCFYTELIGEFIKEAKRLHKTVIFDIDDLVIDTKYTDQIPYVQALPPGEKREYDDGVMRMGKVLSLCDAAITTTERLAQELRHYVPEVIVNRNTASERMLQLSEDVLAKKAKTPKDEKEVKVGYFSGSITHNSDFKMILPVIVRILKEYPAAELHIAGELDVPEELRPFSKRVIKRDFTDWENLPGLIGSVDINLAPIEANIFNEAKSENKWIEAALVKVPTVASNFGAFQRVIDQNRTGLLCSSADEWYCALKRLIEDPGERSRIAENAYEYCRKRCVTLYTGFSLAKYIRSKMTKNAVIILPSLGISGGIMVALKHAGFLYDAGYDVFLINEDPGPCDNWVYFQEYRFPVISKQNNPIFAHIDKAVATMWSTVQFLEVYPNIRERYYLVQNFETDFYTPGNMLRIQANQSYSPSHPIHFITISKWCQDWLWNDYEQKSALAPNGIHYQSFRPHKRILGAKIRILIEGDCGVHYKNVDESFRIVDELDPERYEIWYMSYNAGPKPEYRVDRFLHKVPYEKVFEVYAQCDILLKSSFLESFSYPPLEMMASGGYVVVVPNHGNREYLRDRENCLLYPKGDIRKAIACIEEICWNVELQETLYENGLETAKSRDWEAVRTDILALYGVEKSLGIKEEV